MPNKTSFLILPVFLSLVLGCNKEAEPSKEPTKGVAIPLVANKTSHPKTDVAKIIFVGQKKACDCTEKRIRDSWQTLQNTLNGRQDITVEQIQLDVENEQADELDDLRSLMVAPGVYFFDANEHLIEMLQGELTSKQITKALQ